jgi:hypothetical protein
MSMKLRVYLDTSVLSAKLDHRDASRQRLTELFWSRFQRIDPLISAVVLAEIEDTPDPTQRAALYQLANTVGVLPDNAGVAGLVEAYLADGVFTTAMINDARHVAYAVLANVPVLASWNFRHLVNRTRRIRVNLVNASQGFGQVEIVSPPEIE